MTKWKKDRCNVDGPNGETYHVVWDQYNVRYRIQELRLYLNGPTQEEWGQLWKFTIVNSKAIAKSQNDEVNVPFAQEALDFMLGEAAHVSNE